MSRVGESPISIPDGVTVSVDGDEVSVKGAKGELSRILPSGLSASLDEGLLSVARSGDDREDKAMHGLYRSLLNNMVVGVTEGFVKHLEIVGVGYRAQAKGKDKLELAVGFSHPVTVEAPEGVTFEVPEPTKVEVHGVDKEAVGQVAADIRAVRKPEPYKGKGIRYVDEHVRRKAGKAAATA